MKKLHFITGSQDLYGEATLKQVALNAKEITKYLESQLKDTVEIVWQPTVRNQEEITEACVKASTDKDCVGVITWMHTFSPAKMWIRGLQLLSKPMLHLHTQANERLPYASINMDFMNLNQAAHGDREFGHICTKMNIKRQIVVGFYKNKEVVEQIRQFANVAKAIDFSYSLKLATFGSNMREVAVTDGDRVASQIKFGFSVNYYAVGDLVEIINSISNDQVEKKFNEYLSKYELNTKDVNSVKEQAKYEVALEKFINENKIGAFTDTFQDLHGLKQLPGLAVQNLMARGIGFGAEGDYKTSAMMAILCKMAEGRKGATAFLENYTYDLARGKEVELASHMLEVSPTFAVNKPKIEVHPLGIGGKEAPARLVFDGIQGDGISVSLVDLGDRFRIVVAKLELIKQPEKMPNLPVARVMWKAIPNLPIGAAAWIYAGGAHHTVVSTALNVSDIRLFAKLTDTELVVIDENTTCN